MKKIDISYLILGCSVMFTLYVIGRGFFLNYYSFGSHSISSNKSEYMQNLEKDKDASADNYNEELHKKMREEKIEKAVAKNKKNATYAALAQQAKNKLESLPVEQRAKINEEIQILMNDMQVRLNYNKSNEEAQLEEMEKSEDKMLQLFKRHNLID